MMVLVESSSDACRVFNLSQSVSIKTYLLLSFISVLSSIYLQQIFASAFNKLFILTCVDRICGWHITY